MSEVEATVDAVVAMIRRMAIEGDLPKALATASLKGETPIDELALNSLGKMNLLVAIDEGLGIFIPEDLVTPSMTLRGLAEKLAKKKVVR